MGLKTNFSILVIILIATLTLPLASAVSVSSVTGTISHGSTITITGSAFGTKNNPTQTVPAAPLIWDVTSQQYIGGQNMNAYSSISDGNTINTQIWQLINFAGNGDTARLTTSRQHRNPFVTAHYFGTGTKTVLGDPMYPNGAVAGPSTQKAFYLSFYRKLRNGAGTTGGGSASTKIMRIDTHGYATGLGGGNYLTHQGYQGGGVTTWIDPGTETNWVRWEMYVDLNRGWFDVWKNGHYHLGSWSGAGGTVEIRPAADWRFRTPGLSGFQFNIPIPANDAMIPVLFGYDDSLDNSNGQEIDMSEIYYDNTLARVEISDQATWNDAPSSTSTREVQGRLLMWNSTSISLILHQGSFNTLVGKYLYVIDSNGNVNANGYFLTGVADTTPPTQVTGLTATAVSSSQINLAWTAATDANGVAGYRIYRGGINIANTSSTSYSNTGLSANTSYSYTVAAYDGSGNLGTASSSASATTQAVAADTAPPNQVTGLGATATSSSQINLNWNTGSDNVGVTGYAIYRGATNIANTSSTSYSNTGLTQNTTYSYTIRAYDAAGNLGAASSSASATTQAVAAPSNECSSMQPGWVFCSEFEEGNKAIWDDYDGNPDSTNLIMADGGPNAESGNNIMRFRMPAGRGGSDLIKVLPSSYDRLYARWYIKYEPGFDLTADNHGGGLHAGDRNLLGSSDNRPDGTNWFSSWIDYDVSAPHNFQAYSYYRGMYQDCTNPVGSCWGDHFPCTGGGGYCTRAQHTPQVAQPSISTNRWYCVEMMMDGGTATPTETGANGQMQIWVDGTSIGNWNDLWFRTTNNLDINILWLNLFHHGSHSTEGVMYDNVVVSTQRIGCLGGGSGDLTNPTVSLTAPSAGTMSGVVTLSASASDNIGVAGVQFRVDGTDVGNEDTSAPYSISWNSSSVANGSHTITAVARDAAGNIATSTGVIVNVQNVPTQTLLAEYGFEEPSGTNVNDDSGYGNDATLVSGPVRVALGRYGRAVRLDGVDDYINLPQAFAAGRGEYTIEFWINASRWANTDTLYDEWASGSYWQFTLMRNAWMTRDSSTGTTGGRNNDLTLPAVTLNTWNHLAFVYSDSGNTKTIYLNGVSAGSSTTSIDILTLPRDATARIGYPADGSYYQGMIDEVRIYSKALSQAEVQSDMNSPISAPITDTTAPGQVTGLSATAVSTSQINLAWNATNDNVGVTGYAVYRGASNVANSTNTSYSNTGLSANTLYSYSIRAYDAAGNLGTASATSSATTSPVADTTPPNRTNGNPTGVLTYDTTQVTLSISTDESATCRYSTTPGLSYSAMTTPLAATGGVAHTRLITSLSWNATYNYYVKCIDIANNTNTNDYIITFSIAAPLPIQGDLNGDWQVNLLDIQLLVNNFGRTNGYPASIDIASPGIIDLFDVIAVVRNWGRTL